MGLSKNKYKQIEGNKNTNIARKFYELITELNIKDVVLWGGNYFLDFLSFMDGCNWLIWDKRCNDVKNDFADGEMAWISNHTVLRIYRQLWNGYCVDGEERKEKRLHPAQKPVRMLSEIINDFISEDKIIFDAFAGCGSILIASEKLNRTCYCMEIDENYCDIIINRYKQLTGIEPKKLSYGEKF